MKKFLKVFLVLFVLINLQNKTYAIPIGPIKNILLELFEKTPSFFDDIFKGGKKVDDAIINNSSKEIDNLNLVLKDQDTIFKKISNQKHNDYFNSLKNNSNENIAISHGIKTFNILLKRGKKLSENIFDLFDFEFSNNEQIKIEPYIIKSWTGKVYRNSSYFNQPKFEEKMLLICKDDNQIFYFSILIDNQEDISRAYLTDHFKIKNEILKFEKQELLVLLDEDETKIMSTKPLSSSTFPNDYFIIKSNQYFQHIKNIDPHKIINDSKNIRVKRQFLNRCYKAKLNGVLY